MKRSAALALAALALSTAGAAAQTSPYYDAWRDAELELGARYIYGQLRTPGIKGATDRPVAPD